MKTLICGNESMTITEDEYNSIIDSILKAIAMTITYQVKDEYGNITSLKEIVETLSSAPISDYPS